MKAKRFLFCIVFFIFIGLSFSPPVGAKMVKEVAMGLFLDAPTLEEGTLFYLNQHGPEVLQSSGPWMTRYQAWMPYEPPEEAVELFGAVRGRYGELWFREDDYLDRGALKGASRPPWVTEGRSISENMQTNVMIPCHPTEEFYDSDPYPPETPILRWVTVISYPKGVSFEEGEKWFLEVYAKEAVKQPGLLKFVSHSVLNYNEEMPGGGDMSPEMMEFMSRPRPVRLCEYWYNDFDAWRKAVLESPPKYTAPPWGGEFPFVNMVSTFLPYYPDIDFMKGTYTPGVNKPITTNYSVKP